MTAFVRGTAVAATSLPWLPPVAPANAGAGSIDACVASGSEAAGASASAGVAVDARRPRWPSSSPSMPAANGLEAACAAPLVAAAGTVCAGIGPDASISVSIGALTSTPAFVDAATSSVATGLMSVTTSVLAPVSPGATVSGAAATGAGATSGSGSSAPPQRLQRAGGRPLAASSATRNWQCGQRTNMARVYGVLPPRPSARMEAAQTMTDRSLSRRCGRRIN